MAISSFSAAFTACEESDWSLTNLHVQKLLFFAQKAFLGRTHKPLLKEGFEAWDLGPVVPKLYFELRKFGADPVTFIPTVGRKPNLTEHQVVREVVRHFRGVPAGRLVDLTHKSGGAWDINYVPGVRGIVIPNSDILTEYNEENRDRVH